MRKKILYSLFIIIILFFAFLNYIGYHHAYKFTHYVNVNQSHLKVADNSNISLSEKLVYILKGVDVPRPKNDSKPSFDYETIKIPSKKGTLEVWMGKNKNPLGTVILFHGYANRKSSLISRATKFYEYGYNVMLVDFLGSGGSDGSTASIGYFEADQVQTCYEYVKYTGEPNIYLFGISMGAVAIMKCAKENQPAVKGIMLECPFGYFKTTIKKRFKNFGIPAFPMADLLMLWGSYHTGYWTYSHNPAEYAKEINCPTLILYGENDHAVTRKEINDIYRNIHGEKFLKVFENTGHDIYTNKNRYIWLSAICDFLVNTKTLKENPVPHMFYRDKNEIDF